MKLVGLQIKRLYGCYDYDVKFNSDVTFIYGANGCGKTTILNITEAIITGQIFKLFTYKFNKIILHYADFPSSTNVKFIRINYEKPSIVLFFNNEKYFINRFNDDEEAKNNERSFEEKTKVYFMKYPILEKIRRMFNYVYLPLNRSVMANDEDYPIYYNMWGYIPFGVEPFEEPNIRDATMTQVESIIRFNINRMNSNLAEVSDKFRNNILKSLLDVNNQISLDESISTLINSSNNELNIRETQNAYIKLLNELSLITKKEEKYYNEFFDKIIRNMQDNKNNQNEYRLDFVFQFSEIQKMKNLINYAEEFENMKSIIKNPLDTFLDTMNGFVKNSDDGKEIKVDNLGRIYFITKYGKKPISIHNLSSGEKQLITFFTHLIFNVKKDTTGIFVIDEPELSLHLSWQKIFVEKMLSINNNIQLIFATHSPEIIGKYRNKMFKLEKIYINEGEDINV